MKTLLNIKTCTILRIDNKHLSKRKKNKSFSLKRDVINLSDNVITPISD